MWNTVTLSLISFLLLRLVCCQFIPDPASGSEFTVDLSNGTYGQIVNIPGNLSSKFNIVNVAADTKFLIVQCHSYLQNASIIHQSSNSYSSVQGTNVGLVLLPFNSTSQFTVANSYSSLISTFIYIQAFNNSDVVPGGCNLEMRTEMAPYLVVEERGDLLEVRLAPARSSIGLPCNASSFRYRLFLSYSQERDFSLQTYFLTIQSMLTPADVIDNGFEVGSGGLRRVLASYPGTGLVIAILAETPDGRTTAYIPGHTFGSKCHYSGQPECHLSLSTFARVELVFLCVVGSVMCFYSGRWRTFELFIMSSVMAGLVGFTSFYEMDLAKEYASFFIGLLVGCCCLIYTCVRKDNILQHLIPFTCLAFFFTASLFFIGLGRMDALSNEGAFWVVVVCLTLCLTMTLFCHIAFSHLLSTTVIGGYLILLPVDYFSGTSLKYVVFDMVRRAALPDFLSAYAYPPFQTPDVVVTVCMASIVVTLMLSRLSRRLRLASVPHPEAVPLLHPLSRPSTSRYPPSPPSPHISGRRSGDGVQGQRHGLGDAVYPVPSSPLRLR